MIEDLNNPKANEWYPSSAEQETIDQLMTSDNLEDRALGVALQRGFFVEEYYDELSGRTFNVVGRMSALEKRRLITGKELKLGELTMRDCILLDAQLGEGRNKIERINDGLKKVEEFERRLREQGSNNQLKLFIEYEQNGYLVSIFQSPNQRLKNWYVHISEIGETDKYVRKLIFPGSHSLTANSNTEDISLILFKIDKLMEDLPNLF